MELEKKTTLLLDPTSTQFDKDFFLKKDNNMNANISQSSENNDDLSLAAGYTPGSNLNNLIRRIKTESGNGDIDLSKPVPKGNVKKAQPGKKWDWLPCHYELKREEQGTEIYWNLNPIIQLVNPDSKAAPQIDISIDMERPFMYNSEVGWNWHKSWNLPNITVNAKIFEPKTKIPLLPPADLRAQLFAVKVLLNRVEQVKLFDLNLKGSTPQDLSEGSCTFSGVKFSSTSYNNDGVKFHLVLLVCIQDDPRNRLCPKILFSKISPPIFVDSRKAARNSHVFKSKKINSVYFSSFPPDTFTRSFVKRNNKINDSKEEVIENNLEGLSHYFTAPNIRNKVKHPLFLAFKFSNCVKLSYNADLIKEITEQDQINEESLIYAMQKTFLENHQSKREKGDFSNISNKAFDNKYFILVIEEPENTDSFLLNKKIGDYLEPIINDVLHILFNSNLLPPHFSAFPMENIANSYSTIYPRLMSLKESYGESLDEDNEDFEENSDDEHYKTEFNSKRKRSENAFDFDDSDEEGPRAPTASASKKKVKADKKKPKVANKPSSEEKVANEGSAKKSKSGAPAANKKVKKSELMAQKEAQKAKPSTKVETPQFDPPSASMKMESENIMAKDEENSFDETGSRMGASSMVDQTKLEISESFMSLKREMITKTEPKDNTQSFGGFPSNINPYMGMQQQQYHQHQQQQSQQRFTQQNANGSQNHLMSMMYEQFMKNPKTVPEPNAHLQNQQQQQQQQQPQNQHQQVDPRQQFLEVQIMKRQQQLLQLQSKLKEMQEKVTVNKTSNTSSHDKLNQPNEMPPSQPDLRNLPPNMPNQSFANQAYFNNMQYPKMMLDRSGNNMMENKQIGHSIPENYMRGPYPGLQMAGQAKNQMGQMGVPAAFFNFQQDGTLGNMAKGKGPISGPKQTK